MSVWTILLLIAALIYWVLRGGFKRLKEAKQRGDIISYQAGSPERNWALALAHPMAFHAIKGGFADYPLWIRSVFTSPSLSDGRKWTFWQYSNRGRLSSHTGREEFIDLNVFNGSQEEFRRFMEAGILRKGARYNDTSRPPFVRG